MATIRPRADAGHLIFNPSSRGRCGSNPSSSLTGCIPAKLLSSYAIFLSALWRIVRSPLHGHTNAWSPKRSMQPPQHGQTAPCSKMCMRMRLRTETQYREVSIVRSSSKGGAISQTPTPGRLQSSMWPTKARSTCPPVFNESFSDESMSDDMTLCELFPSWPWRVFRAASRISESNIALVSFQWHPPASSLASKAGSI